MRAMQAAIGRIRLARGRCPSCASDVEHARACGTCHAYQGPFPVSEETRRRWQTRFARSRAFEPLARAPERPVAVLSPVN